MTITNNIELWLILCYPSSLGLGDDKIQGPGGRDKRKDNGKVRIKIFPSFIEV